MVPDIVWTSFPERTASRCRGLFERGPRRAHPDWVHCQTTQGATGSNLGEGLDHHDEDDGEREGLRPPRAPAIPGGIGIVAADRRDRQQDVNELQQAEPAHEAILAPAAGVW